MMGERESPACAHNHIFSIKPGVKPPEGTMRSEYTVISNVAERLWCSDKIEYSFDFPSPTDTKIF